MSALAVGSIVFICVFGGALLGMFLRSILPEHHLSAESKDAVKVGIGLIATMAALVLGLLVATAKASYDAKSNELTEMSANTVMLDRCWRTMAPRPGAFARCYAASVRTRLRPSGRRTAKLAARTCRRGRGFVRTRLRRFHQRTMPSAHSRARHSTSRSISPRRAGCCSSNRAGRSPRPF